MRTQWSKAKPGARFWLAVLAGVLLAGAFPKLGMAGLAWVAPGLLLSAALGTRKWEAFRVGYIGGLAYYLLAYHWLLWIPYRWLGMPLGPALGWIALSSYLALYPAVWVCLVNGLADGVFGSTGANASSPGAGVLGSMANTLGAPPWWRRSLWCVIGAAMWVAVEMAIARVFSGFPWDLLGVSQYALVPLIQIASWTGVYGVSFLITWVSLALVSAIATMLRNPQRRGAWVSDLALPVTAVAVVFNLGLRWLRDDAPADRWLHVTLVQPSIPQTLIWDESKDNERFSELIALSKLALTNQTDLLIWPEAAVPKLLRYDEETFNAVTALAREYKTWMIIGADDAEPRKLPGKRKADFFNSSFLIRPDGTLMDRYRKRSLVIFGEYVPLERWLPFLKFFTPVDGGFTPGDSPAQFEMKELKAKTSVLICFEDIFPSLGRDSTKADTDFLVNLTNNGWFGEGAAQWQHGITGLFRAVENRIPLIRCSNNGLSCMIDGRGRIRAALRDVQGSIYGPGILNLKVPLLPEGQPRKPTFYNTHGDVFGWSCVCLAIASTLWTAFSRRRNLTQTQN